MKKPWKASLRILFILLLYLAGMILGFIAVGLGPVFQYKDFLLMLAENAADDYVAGEWIEDNIHPNILFMLYDTDGNCLEQTNPPNGNMDFDFTSWVDNNLHTVLSSKALYRFIISIDESRSGHHIVYMTFLCAPVYQDGAIIGVMFLARRLVDFSKIIDAFFVVYTIFFALTTYFFLRTKRNERALEQFRRKYISNISHELKSPIASIRALGGALSDELVRDQQTLNRYYDTIVSEANRLDHAVKGMLELSKMQSRKVDYSKERTSASEIFEATCNRYDALCNDMDISLVVPDSITQLPDLYTNSALITQLLEILLDNAIKFVKENGAIGLSATTSGKRATISVKDNGVGIEIDELPHVFERFYSGNRAYNASGTGLGLAIALEITTMLNEKIWVKSTPGKGTTFHFTIQLSANRKRKDLRRGGFRIN